MVALEGRLAFLRVHANELRNVALAERGFCEAFDAFRAEGVSLGAFHCLCYSEDIKTASTFDRRGDLDGSRCYSNERCVERGDGSLNSGGGYVPGYLWPREDPIDLPAQSLVLKRTLDIIGLPGSSLRERLGRRLSCQRLVGGSVEALVDSETDLEVGDIVPIKVFLESLLSKSELPCFGWM